MKTKQKGLGFKIIGTFTILFIIFNIITVTVNFISQKNNAQNDLREKLRDNSTLSYSYIDNKYLGKWSYKGGFFKKGITILTDEHAVMDSIKESTDTMVAIYADDSIIATNITKNDVPTIGEKAPKNITDRVLKKGKVYEGEVKLPNGLYMGRYIPLKDDKDNVIGMYFTGVSEEDTIKYIQTILIKSIIINVVMLLVSISIYLVIVRKIINNIKKILDVVNEVEQGNLNIKAEISSKDEISTIGYKLNSMIDNLRSLIGRVQETSSMSQNSAITIKESSEQIGLTSEEVAKTITEIANVASEQASCTQIGVDKAENLSKSIEKVSNSLQNILNQFKNTNELSDTGLNTVKLLIDKSNENITMAKKVEEVVKLSANHSEEIGSIISTIENFAKQTNLLSLNASIESAKAGEQGKGFSVIATEIRKLADQSSTATNNIKKLIEQLQEQSKIAVNTINQSEKIVRDQMEVVTNTENTFNEIRESIKKTTDSVNEISVLNTDMINKKEEIINAMLNISASAQETSASTEEISASTEEQTATIEELINSISDLSNMVEILKNEIGMFKL